MFPDIKWFAKKMSIFLKRQNLQIEYSYKLDCLAILFRPKPIQGLTHYSFALKFRIHVRKLNINEYFYANC